MPINPLPNGLLSGNGQGREGGRVVSREKRFPPHCPFILIQGLATDFWGSGSAVCASASRTKYKRKLKTEFLYDYESIVRVDSCFQCRYTFCHACTESLIFSMRIDAMEIGKHPHPPAGGSYYFFARCAGQKK